MRKFVVLLIIVVASASAQVTGRINGLVIDQTTGTPVVGANVWLYGTDIGIATDAAGKFHLDQIEPGKYEVRVSFIGYEDKTIPSLQVRANQITPLEIKLATTRIQQDGIEVKEKANRSGEVNRILEQKAAESIVSGFSAAEIRKTGDSNAGQVLKRVTGVTVVDDKFVYVRGLGERYSNTMLNNVGIPSPEPDRKSIPLNMFSSALIEKINVFKSFSPDLPGAFAGGNVDIRTKSYPDGFTFKSSFSAGSNSNLSSARYLTNNVNGANDFFGFDDGTREIPRIIDADNPLPKQGNFYFYQIPDDFHPELDVLAYPDRPDDDPLNMFITTPEQTQRIKLYRGYLGDVARSFSNGFSYKTKNPGTPMSFGVSGGNKWILNDDIEYGFYALGSFSNGYGYTENHRNLFSRVGEDSLAVDETLDVNSSSYKTNLGLSASWGVKWRENIKVDFNSIYTHTSKDEVKYVIGIVYDLDNPAGLLMSHPYQEKSIRSYSLKTEMKDLFYIPYVHHHTMDLLYSDSRSEMDEPDRRDHYYDLDFEDDGGIGDPIVGYNLMHTSYLDPGYRFFADGWEDANSYGLDYTLEADWKLKIGYRTDIRTRSFQKRVFTYSYYNQTSPWSNTIPADWREISSADSIGWFFVEDNIYSYDLEQDTASVSGLFVIEEQDDINQNAYSADETVDAAYAMLTLPLLQEEYGSVIFGARRENYKLDLRPFNPVTGEATQTEGEVAVDTTLLVNDVLVDTTLMMTRNVPLVSSLDMNDLLPSLAFIINTTAKTQVRLSASQTVARPQFREIAPYTYIEFHGGQRSIGNIYLKTTEIKNYDLRWEWYPSASEMISLGAFVKQFRNPIEVSLIKQTDDKYYKTWQNADKGWSRGIEFEIRRKLPVIGVEKGVSYINFNATYTDSEAESDSAVVIYNNGRVETRNSSANLKRPLQGQSDLVVNASVNMQLRTGWDFNVSYNSYSKRLAFLGAGRLDDEYEYPFHSLNFVLGKKFGDHTKVSLKARNLLDSEHKFGMEDPQDSDKILETRVWKPGMSISLGISYDLAR